MKIPILKKSAFILVLLIFLSPKNSLSTQNENILDLTSSYIDNLKTFKANFVQFDGNGSVTNGKLFIKRPGRMRIEYEPSAKMLIIIDGFYLIYIDLEIDEATYTDLDSTPAKFLLDPDWSFAKNANQIEKIINKSGLIEITLKAEDVGELTFIFTQDPMELRQWRIKDRANKEIIITLYDIEKDIDLDTELFKYNKTDIFNDD